MFRAVDRRAGRTLQHVAANSTFVRDRIRAAWGVDARVIHPPVDVARLTSVADWAEHLNAQEQDVLRGLPESFILGASRFVPYKRLDAVITGGAAAGMPVVIAGAGPDERRLRAVAADADTSTTFVIAPSDALMAALMQRASVFVFPPIEDFGIMPVEAMALGTPVVVNAVGGAAESVLHGVTGSTIDTTDPQTVAAGIHAALGSSPAACRGRADDFSTDRFLQNIQRWTGLPITRPHTAGSPNALRMATASNQPAG
jgi:glycosyltransferase involved in cell wall biosynthesis